jgi:osmotically-inducible protein OsmY
MVLRMSNQTERKTSPARSIAATADARFRANSHTALRGISCKSDQGVLTLEGRLSTFFQKQLAQEIVANIEGVVQVVNNIEVAA